MGIVSGVDGSSRNVGHLTRAEDAVFIAHPLLGAAIDDVDDFLPMRVVVKRVAMAGVHVGSHQEELLSGNGVRAAEPFIVCPRVRLPLGVLNLNETTIGWILAHGLDFHTREVE